MTNKTFYPSLSLLPLDYIALISEQVWQLRDNWVAAKPLSSDGDTLKLKIKQLESELRQTKEDKFNSETKIMLLGMILLIYRYVGIKLQRFFEDILSSRTNSNRTYTVYL